MSSSSLTKEYTTYEIHERNARGEISDGYITLNGGDQSDLNAAYARRAELAQAHPDREYVIIEHHETHTTRIVEPSGWRRWSVTFEGLGELRNIRAPMEYDAIRKAIARMNNEIIPAHFYGTPAVSEEDVAAVELEDEQD